MFFQGNNISDLWDKVSNALPAVLALPPGLINKQKKKVFLLLRLRLRRQNTDSLPKMLLDSHWNQFVFSLFSHDGDHEEVPLHLTNNYQCLSTYFHVNYKEPWALTPADYEPRFFQYLGAHFIITTTTWCSALRGRRLSLQMCQWCCWWPCCYDLCNVY